MHCGVCIANRQADACSAVALSQQVPVIDYGLLLCFTLGKAATYLGHFPKCTNDLATSCQSTRSLNSKGQYTLKQRLQEPSSLQLFPLSSVENGVTSNCFYKRGRKRLTRMGQPSPSTASLVRQSDNASTLTSHEYLF
jgi:hypothetical protein